MNFIRLSRKAIRGLPYLAKEIRSFISNHTPFFIARPRVVHLWRNGPCDGGCIMCHLGFTQGKQREELFHSPITDDMIPGLLRQIQEVGGRGTMVSYMCGEPLLSRPLLGWIELARDLNLDFRFTTNGYHIDRQVARRLVGGGLFNLGISIESLDPAINEQIRPYRNSTQKVTDAIALLLEEKERQKSALSLNLKCTLTSVNLESVLDLLKRYGLIDGVIVTPQMFEPLKGMPEETRDKLWIKEVSRIEAVVAELKAMRARGYHLNAEDANLDDFVRLYRNDPHRHSTMHERTVRREDQPQCHIGTDNLFITNGDVRLCPNFRPIGTVIGNGPSLASLWYSDRARQMRSSIRKCRSVCTLSCTRRNSLTHKIRTFLKM